MSRASKKQLGQHESQSEIYFDTKKDINPFWKSSLFSDVYIKNDVPREYRQLWENEEIGNFYNFYQGFLDLCLATKSLCFEKLKEADTVKDWIVPVMSLLGWEDNAEKHQNSYIDNESFTVYENGRKQTYRPDLIFFDKPSHKAYTQKEKEIENKLAEAKNKKTGAKIVVEAKYWDKLSQKKENTKRESITGDSASALGPELQTLKYMDMFGHDFGILTDGKTWRLFHSELSQGLDRRSYDFDLGNLRELALEIDKYGNEDKFRHYAKYFYYFFSKEALVFSETTKVAPFVYQIFEYSKKYAHSIEEDLKKRFIITMGLTCNALKKSAENSKIAIDVDTIRNVAESHLFNFLFVKSCEVRRILPINSTKYLRCSLHEVVETIDAMSFDPEKDKDDFLRDFRHTLGKRFDWAGYEIFNRFIDLYEIIHDGTATSKDFGFEISGFKESIFTAQEWKLAKSLKISNDDMVEILFSLNFIESSFAGRKFQQIPYSYFSSRQLGSIYESFLEYKLVKAEMDLVFTQGEWKPANLNSSHVRGLRLADKFIVKKGQLFFSPNNAERKMTGTYYTPEYIVQYVVSSTVGESIKGLTSDQILNYKILDPAMGSGHFLSGALDYLVSAYRKKWAEEHNDDLDETIEETSRKILDTCLYGVDINPRAVKLAKMSLWLMTAYPGKKLECLEDQLHSLSSLEKASALKSKFKKVFKDGGFDSILGNPPYVGEKGNKELFRDVLSKNESLNVVAKGKMDFFYFFIYQGIELLKDGGSLSFITTAYWPTADGAAKLRNYLLDNTNLKSFIDFGNVTVFEEAKGQHSLVFMLEKCKTQLQKPHVRKYIGSKRNLTLEDLHSSEDWASNELIFKSQDYKDKVWHLYNSNEDFSSINGDAVLEDLFHVGCGVRTTADTMSKKKLELLSADSIKKNKITEDSGIFVLTNSEVNKLQGSFSRFEKSLIKQWYKNSDINSFSYDKNTSLKHLYVTNKIEESDIPNILKYLELFKPVLAYKKEHYGESNLWYAVNRASEDSVCKKEKIVTPYRSKSNRFAYVSDEFFSSMDVYFITYKDEKKKPKLTLKALASILNSKVISQWCKGNMKSKGEMIEFYATPLKAIPLPDMKLVSDKVLQELEDLYDRLSKFDGDSVKIESSLEFAKLNAIVSKIYHVQSSEAAA